MGGTELERAAGGETKASGVKGTRWGAASVETLRGKSCLAAYPQSFTP